MRELCRGLNIIAEELSEQEGLLFGIAVHFDFTYNFYKKLLRLHNGNLERTLKEILYCSLGQVDNVEQYISILHSIMIEYDIIGEYGRILGKNNLRHVFIPE